MKQIDPATQVRIDRFMEKKTRQYPELAKKRAQHIEVQQRERFFEGVAHFFTLERANA